MYSHSDLQAKFGELVTQRQQADAEALSNDSTVASAKRTLEAKQQELANLQAYIASLPSKDRAAYLSSLDTYLLAVSDAERAVTVATNSFWRDRRLQARNQEKAERDRALEAEQKQYAAEQEAQFKEAKRVAWLAAGSTEAQFNAAYPTLWQEELRRRADEQEKGLHQRMHREVGYVKF